MSIRIGFYTGKLYDSSVDIDSIKECCEVLNDEDPICDHEELAMLKHLQLKLNCIDCNACEESQKDIKK